MDPSRDELARIEAQLNADPNITAFARAGGGHPIERLGGLARAVAQSGIQMPHDYGPYIENGRIVLQKKGFLERNPWVLPAVAVGAPVAGAFGLGALGVPGFAGGSAAAGAAPAATTGLSGPLAGLPVYGANGAVMGGSGAAAGGAAAGAGALAGRVPSWLRDVIKVGAPIGFGMTNRGSGGGNQSALPPELMQQMQDLLGMSIDRQKRSDPLHQAAIAMATRLTPAYARNAITRKDDV